MLGDTRTVDLASLSARSSPWRAASEKMWFRSLVWLASAALAAVESSEPERLEQAVSLAVRYARATADPGGADLRVAAELGWDEGTVTRRQESINCLLALSADRRLVPVLRPLAAANLDPRRYYGPPERLPHNHGLMANFALLTTGWLLKNPHYRSAALDRMWQAFRSSFSPQGMTIEGSSAYQFMHLQWWQQVPGYLRTNGSPERAAAVASMMPRILTAARHLLRPNGALLVIGNGLGSPTLRQDPAAPLVFRDPTALFAARFSWTRPTSTYLTMRVGRRRSPHGHDDYGSLTWEALGQPVIVDPGFYDYSDQPITRWLRSRLAHNVPLLKGDGTMTAVPWSGSTARLGRSAQETSSGVVRARVERAKTPSARVQRSVSYDTSGRLRVSDTGRLLRAHRFTLSSDFVARAAASTGRRATFIASSGARLSVAVPRGQRLVILRARRSSFLGWTAVGWRDLRPAFQITNRGRRKLTTSFRLVAG